MPSWSSPGSSRQCRSIRRTAPGPRPAPRPSLSPPTPPLRIPGSLRGAAGPGIAHRAGGGAGPPPWVPGPPGIGCPAAPPAGRGAVAEAGPGRGRGERNRAGAAGAAMSFCSFFGGEVFKDHFQPGERGGEGIPVGSPWDWGGF